MTSQRHLLVRYKRRMLALREYTRLAGEIPEVVRISLSDDFAADVFTHFEGGNERSIFERLVGAELRSFGLIKDEGFDYHVVHLNGGQLEHARGYGGIEPYRRSDEVMA